MVKPSTPSQRILLLDPTPSELAPLQEAFALACKDRRAVERIKHRADLLEQLRNEEVALVVIDYQLGDGQKTGLSILHEVRQAWTEGLILMVAKEGDIDSATESIRAGATDFLVRSQRLTERVDALLHKVRKFLRLIEQNRSLDQLNRHLRERERANHQIIGQSPQVREVIERIQRIAPVPRPVLITGERGTGKELVARALHNASTDERRPFVVVNCAAFSDTLLENELFGHEEGSFTGASRTSLGKFELAHGGTLFLDEIGHMSLAFQQKILRVVEYGTLTRVGGHQEIQVEVRIIAATNANLQDKISCGEFLPDLYDRLAFEILHVPPLRERQGDIALLSQYFLQKFIREVPAFHERRLSQESLQALQHYHFPGNVRELKNMIERATYQDTSTAVTPQELGLYHLLTEENKLPFEKRETLSYKNISLLPSQKNVSNTSNFPINTQQAFQEQVDAFAIALLEKALETSRYNQAKAARSLQLSYHQFRYYVKKYNLLGS